MLGEPQALVRDDLADTSVFSRAPGMQGSQDPLADTGAFCVTRNASAVDSPVAIVIAPLTIDSLRESPARPSKVRARGGGPTDHCLLLFPSTPADRGRACASATPPVGRRHSTRSPRDLHNLNRRDQYTSVAKRDRFSCVNKLVFLWSIFTCRPT